LQDTNEGRNKPESINMRLIVEDTLIRYYSWH